VALHFAAGEPGRDREAAVSVGGVAIRGGRVLLGESLEETVAAHGAIAASLRALLDGEYLVVWSVDAEAAFLDRIFGGARTRWSARTIDVSRLAAAADRLPGSVVGPEGHELPAVARRYRVPLPQPHDLLDGALTIAQLFLVLATKLAAHGHPDVASLLRETRRAGTRSVPL